MPEGPSWISPASSTFPKPWVCLFHLERDCCLSLVLKVCWMMNVYRWPSATELNFNTTLHLDYCTKLLFFAYLQCQWPCACVLRPINLNYTQVIFICFSKFYQFLSEEEWQENEDEWLWKNLVRNHPEYSTLDLATLSGETWKSFD